MFYIEFVISFNAAASINAKAFAHRTHIYLGNDQSADDLGLMAHELTHTTQQKGVDPLVRRHRVAPTQAAGTRRTGVSTHS